MTKKELIKFAKDFIKEAETNKGMKAGEVRDKLQDLINDFNDEELLEEEG